MNSTGKLNNIIILLLLSIVIYQSCLRETSLPQTKTETIVKWDTLHKIDTILSPQYYTILKTDTIIIPPEIDTLSIIKDYFAKVIYIDTINLDSLGFISIKDTIFNNRILSRIINKNIYFPTVYETTTITLNPREFYVGFGVGTNQVSGEILLRNKNKQAYGIGIGLDNNLNPFLTGKIYWKL